MLNLIELISAESMRKYPFLWQGSADSGHISKYVAFDGLPWDEPQKGDYVFRSNREGTHAYVVTYANEKTRKIKVKRTNLCVEHNGALREHKRRFPEAISTPSNCSISLVEGIYNAY